MTNPNESKPTSSGSGTHNKVLADVAVRIAVGILMLWAAYITNTLAQSQTSSADLAIRTELLEQTRVAHSELFEFERTIDTKFDEAISELKDCLNKIQQDRLCD